MHPQLGVPGKGKVHNGDAFESNRTITQMKLHQIATGPSVWLEIARKIEDSGGFWGPRKETANGA